MNAIVWVLNPLKEDLYVQVPGQHYWEVVDAYKGIVNSDPFLSFMLIILAPWP